MRVKAPKCGVREKYDPDDIKFRFIMEKQSVLNVEKSCNFLVIQCFIVIYFVIYVGGWVLEAENPCASDHFGVLKIDTINKMSALKADLSIDFTVLQPVDCA